MLDEDIELDEEEYVEEEQEELLEEEPKEEQDELKKQREVLPTEGVNFYMANRLYYETQDYDEAIKMYQSAIDEESDELIVVKSLYYMAESYVKLQKLDEAISVFEHLVERLSDHYLAASAKRRIDVLKEEMEL